MLTIRNERPEDYAAVEELTRRAFYNVYVPGCTEHYLVHIMRGHRDFLPELDFVAELDGRLIGNIMYTRSWLTDGDGNRREVLTFGPVSILPECQRKGYGKQPHGAFLCQGQGNGLWGGGDLRQSGQLCEPGIYKLQKIPRFPGRGQVSRGHAGEGADTGHIGRQHRDVYG